MAGRKHTGPRRRDRTTTATNSRHQQPQPPQRRRQPRWCWRKELGQPGHSTSIRAHPHPSLRHRHLEHCTLAPRPNRPRRTGGSHGTVAGVRAAAAAAAAAAHVAAASPPPALPRPGGAGAIMCGVGVAPPTWRARSTTPPCSPGTCRVTLSRQCQVSTERGMFRARKYQASLTGRRSPALEAGRIAGGSSGTGRGCRRRPAAGWSIVHRPTFRSFREGSLCGDVGEWGAGHMDRSPAATGR